MTTGREQPRLGARSCMGSRALTVLVVRNGRNGVQLGRDGGGIRVSCLNMECSELVLPTDLGCIATRC
jgi:hypothetical protein